MAPLLNSDIAILVVDDDMSVRIILTELFRDEGYRVEEAGSPLDALRQMAATRFDIVFSDIHMPGMTGIEFLREIRVANVEVQVVIMTADASMETAIEATRLGAADYLRKPFENLAYVTALAGRLAAKVRDHRTKAEALRRAAAAESRDPRSGEARELAGELTDFPLQEILQLVSMMRKTGVLRIAGPAGPGTISVSAGEIWGAEFGPARDFKAIFRMMMLPGGGFQFRPASSLDFPRRMERSADFVMMEGMRHMDEIREMGKSIPPSNILLRYRGPWPPTPASVPGPIDLAVCTHLRNTLDVRALLDAIPEPDLEIYRSLLQLRRAHCLQVMGRRPTLFG